MNLEGYRARIRRLSGLRLTSLLSDADLDEAINEAYRELAGVHPWPQFLFEETVAADEKDVTLPVASRQIESVTLLGDDHQRLAETTLDELDRLDPAEEGPPALYVRVLPTLIRVYPAPTVADPVDLAVRGRKLPDKLTLVADEPEFEEEFHPVLAFVVAARLLGEEGDDSGRREAYAGEVGDLLGRMKQRYVASNDHGLFVAGGQRKRRPSSRVWA